MDIQTICADFKAAIDELGSLRCYDALVLNPTPPCALVKPDFIPPQETLGSDPLIRPRIVVRLLAEATNDTAGTQKLYRWISTGNGDSVVDAIDRSTAVDVSSPEIRNIDYMIGSHLGAETVWLSAELVYDVF
jgi:hypothetical protein